MATQTQVGHTPEPWVVGDHCAEYDIGIVGRKDGQGVLVALVVADEDVVPDDGEVAANARFIVRACNAHDDLLAACKAVDDFYKPVRQGATGAVNTGPLPGNLRDQVREAIAAAEPE